MSCYTKMYPQSDQAGYCPEMVTSPDKGRLSSTSSNTSTGTTVTMIPREPKTLTRNHRLLIIVIVIVIVVVVVTLIVCVSWLGMTLAGLSREMAELRSSAPYLQDGMCVKCKDLKLSSDLENLMLDTFHNKRASDLADEYCCAKTQTQLQSLLYMYVERKLRQAKSRQGSTACRLQRRIVQDNATGCATTTKYESAAHVLIATQRDSQTKDRDGKYSVTNWTIRSSLAFVRVLQFRGLDGRLLITEAGMYYIYSQLHFYMPTYVTSAGSDKSKDGVERIGHYVYRFNIASAVQEEVLLQSSQSQCKERRDSFWEHTSYIGAVFKLKQGDEVFVKVSNIKAIHPDHKSGFFGVYRIQ